MRGELGSDVGSGASVCRSEAGRRAASSSRALHPTAATAAAASRDPRWPLARETPAPAQGGGSTATAPTAARARTHQRTLPKAHRLRGKNIARAYHIAGNAPASNTPSMTRSR